MVYQGAYSFLFSASKSRFGEIGAKIIDYEGLMSFLKNFPDNKLEPHITEKQKSDRGHGGKKCYYLNGLNSLTARVYGRVSYVIDGLAYCYNREKFLDFWSKLSKFTEPFTFKHSLNSPEISEYEYVVSCNQRHVTISRLRIERSRKPEMVEEYASDC